MDMYYHNNREGGFLKWIIVIVIGLVIASYFFDFSVKEAVEDEQTQSNFAYISVEVQEFWNEHLAEAADYLWNDIFIDLLWESFIENLERVKEGEDTVFEENAPGVTVNQETTVN